MTVAEIMEFFETNCNNSGDISYYIWDSAEEDPQPTEYPIAETLDKYGKREADFCIGHSLADGTPIITFNI